MFPFRYSSAGLNYEELFILDFPPALILFMLSLVLFGPPTTCTSSDILIYLFAIPYLYAVFMERTGSLQLMQHHCVT